MKTIVLVLLLMMLVVGCSQVSMSPPYKMVVERAAILTAAQWKDCQAGDPNACRIGLEKAHVTFRLIVDAMYGRPGDPNGTE